VTADRAEPLSLEAVVAALHTSHDRLVGVLTPLSEEQVTGPSYDDGWSIAQVAAHLGSGAEVFDLFIAAGLQQAPAPGVEQFRPVWDRWDAKPAASQARDAVGADAAFLDRLDQLNEVEREAWRLDLFDDTRDLAGVLRMRLTEHALHTWDIAVALDAAATVADDAVELAIDDLSRLVERAGKPSTARASIDVHTTTPRRHLRLELGPAGAQLEPARDDMAGATARLDLTGETFLRLVYGRLDPDHTPRAVTATGIDLDALRLVFPGV
jgi:uncharacterized protein (TIGR03083 family)